MKTIGTYSSPRDAIPEIVQRLHDAEMFGGKINEKLAQMELEPNEAISFLLLEISRLKNNLIECRKTAKRATKHNLGSSMVASQLKDIIEIVDDMNSTTWY